MGFLDNSSITIDAILTRKGRKLLAQGSNLAITKFALSDEEVDYTLYDTSHPSGTDSFGTVIENMNLLEAQPNREGFRSYLVDDSVGGATLTIDTTSYGPLTADKGLIIKPTTDIFDEMYDFTIDNITVIKFNVAGFANSDKYTGTQANIKTQRITTPRTAIITVTGVQSGLSKTVSVTVKKHAAGGTDPDDTTSSNTRFGGSDDVLT